MMNECLGKMAEAGCRLEYPMRNFMESGYVNGANMPGWVLPFLAVVPFIMLALVAWSLVWKGWALWTAARKGSKIWFIVLLVVNTVGILEILYIFFFSKKNNLLKPAEPVLPEQK